MEGLICPWCGEEFADLDFFEQAPEADYPIRCPRCRREFAARYRFEPVFERDVPEELAGCEEGCDLWDISLGCCSYRTRRRGRAPETPGKPADGCPLGYSDE